MTASNQPPLPGRSTCWSSTRTEHEDPPDPGLGEQVQTGEHDLDPAAVAIEQPGRDPEAVGLDLGVDLEEQPADLLGVLGVDELDDVGADHRRRRPGEELRQALVGDDGRPVPGEEGGGDRNAVEEVVTPSSVTHRRSR